MPNNQKSLSRRQREVASSLYEEVIRAGKVLRYPVYKRLTTEPLSKAYFEFNHVDTVSVPTTQALLRKGAIQVDEDHAFFSISDECLAALRQEEAKDRFVKLRGLLNRPPSAALFNEIWRLFSGWETDDEEFDLALDYTLGHLASWPSERRLIQLGTLSRAPVHLLPLVRSLDLVYRGGMPYPDSTQLVEWLSSDGLKDVTHLVADELFTSTDVIMGFLDGPFASSLKGLYIRGRPTSYDQGSAVRLLFNNPCVVLSNLEDVRLNYCSLRAVELQSWADHADQFPHLKRLCLSNNNSREMPIATVRNLARALHLGGSLERLDLFGNGFDRRDINSILKEAPDLKIGWNNRT